jgi:hypothetical protein
MNASSLAVGEVCRQARSRLGGWLDSPSLGRKFDVFLEHPTC